ncbi:MAG: MarR family transcriptional regulator [Altererythrobacter sp.]|nr:MarR family transcriptional regulator [Altererythrobacter sp.]
MKNAAASPDAPAESTLPEDASRSAGSAAIGARLRRLSDRIDRDATQVYTTLGIAFEQRWYGPLTHIAHSGPLSVSDIANRLRITHVSVSQAVAALESHGLVESAPDPADGRRRLLALTGAGRALVDRLTPLWAACNTAAMELDHAAGQVVEALDRLEDQLDQVSLFDRIMEKVAPSC